MAVPRFKDRQLSLARQVRLVEQETHALAVGYANGGFARVLADITDPVEAFRFTTAVHDAPTLFDKVKIISRRDAVSERRRRHQPGEPVAESDANPQGKDRYPRVP